MLALDLVLRLDIPAWQPLGLWALAAAVLLLAALSRRR